ncbi:protein of unknown function DUF262 [Beutenbergia cavernae DSM 12333]|uniref:GmrSD restriction endonucleases N-terminal domain-containing protein n=1 Tax=Beutenbergia cavernae (strain ATCC BAA-8 / DSM 12333 / CCUG 43141 / JCM 11478 / NBRC 16432 / NCIMB 13614 / HKI 0122) TaxID=471853 RepID=C5C357_BEUC1|nr:DUF262 domain-containing protein [Beutenbergia cavernae]ACQ79756.1 protein of unknown function DUF262 [Beutenbergia cavernae DSM 12333]
MTSDADDSPESGERSADLLDRTLSDFELEDLVDGDEAPPAVTYSTQDYPVDGLVKRLERGSMRVPQFGVDDPANATAGFQRGFVWTKGQMDRFIESLLLGYPVPGIFLVKQTDNVMLVLDGQQRLETLRRFYAGTHNARPFALENVSADFRGRTYKTLGEASKLALDDSFMQATIVSTDGSTEVNDAIYRIFERLNSGGTQLTPHEIRVALFAGPLMVLVEELNSFPAWRALFGPPNKRIRDHELVMRIAALYLHAPEYARPLKSFLNNFSAAYRNARELPNDAADLFRRATVILERDAGRGALRRGEVGQVNAAQAEAIIVGLMRKLAQGREPAAVASAISALKGSDEFARVTTRSTADNDAVRDRLSLAAAAFAS